MIDYFIPAFPEIFVIAMTCFIVLLCLFLPKFHNLPYYLTQITLILAAALTFYCAQITPKLPVLLFSDTFVFDRMAVFLKIFIFLSVFIAFLYSHFYNKERRIPPLEFYVLGLLSTFGMMALVSSHNFISLFLSMELMSLPIYAMVALQKGKERCIEAALKYFIIGALASGMLLYGMSLLFAITKTLDISQVSTVLSGLLVQNNLMVLFGLVFVMAGIAFKLGAAPFHMWVPDVYDGSPSSVTLFLSTAPKIAAFGLVIRLLVEAFGALHVQWSEILIVMALLSIAIGNLAAIVQTNIKRMIAYSSIAHMGYMALGLACVTSRGYAAAMFYIVSYSIMTLGAFGVVALLGKAGFEANLIEDYSGLSDRNPWLAFSMMLVMFSLAGVPPIVGFIAKVGIIEALIQVHLVGLAVFVVLFSIIGAYYYIRVVKVMYFEKATSSEPIHYPKVPSFVLGLNGVAILLLGIFPGALFMICQKIFAG